MPLLIEHIDDIARRLNRDVLLIGPDRMTDSHHSLNWKDSVDRSGLLTWLDEQNINWEPCGWLSSQSVMEGYRGDIYLDFPYSAADTRYLHLKAFVQEQEDGSTKWAGVKIYLFSIRFCQNRKAKGL